MGHLAYCHCCENRKGGFACCHLAVWHRRFRFGWTSFPTSINSARCVQQRDKPPEEPTMVDEKEILKQYSYKATSNLVIEQDRRRRSAADSNVAPLQVENLPGRMGDKARPSAGGRKPTDPEELSETVRQPANSAKLSRGDIVDAVDELEIDDNGDTYIPSTEVSRRAFEALLSLVSFKLGDQPRDLLHSAAAEAIAVMKDENQLLEKKREQLYEVLGVKLSSEEFSNVRLFTDRMTDFEPSAGNSRSEQGLTVLMDDEDELDGDSKTKKTKDPDKARLQAELNQLSSNVGLDDVLNLDDSLANYGNDETTGSVPLNVHSQTAESKLATILGPHFSDEETAEKTLVLLNTLRNPIDNQTCENKLLSLLGFDKMDLVADLMEKRDLFMDEESSVPMMDGTHPEGDGNVHMELTGSAKTPIGKNNASKASREVRKRPRSPSQRNEDQNANKDVLLTVDIDSLAAYGYKTRPPTGDCKLPEGSQHIEGKDYEEWYIPPVKLSNNHIKDSLVSVDRLPPWARSAFPSTTRFNKMQSKTFDCAFTSQENMLICAPTGAGKTNVAMLATVQALEKIVRDTTSAEDSFPSLSVVYIAPMKALVAEVVQNFSKRLSSMGVTVRELTGDVNMSSQELRRSHVVVSTPEKWDIVSRKGGSGSLSGHLRLLIIDEIHLLNDNRGAVLESIVTRCRRSFVPNRPKTRIMGLSATLPNYRDVAEFLDVDETKGLFAFDGTYRPCPLQQCFMGISHRKPLKRFQIQNSLAYERTKHQMQNSEQVIIFVHSRKETVSTCKYFIERAIEEEVTDLFLKPGTASFEIVQAELENANGKDLRELMEYGLAVHHAGMPRSDRELVEALFEKGHVRVLVSTATLAWGVNLPAHAVIIKGTLVYSPELGQWTDLSPMDVMQMMGRAGRPQFDTFGEGIIITAKSDVMFYLSVLNNNLPVESQLLSRLVDLLNAEVAAGSVSSVADGADWLQYSYMQVRMSKSPHLYGVSTEAFSTDHSLAKRRKNLVHSAAIKLHRLGLLIYHRETGDLEATALGRIAADFYVSHATMATYVEGLRQNITDVDLLRLVSISGEFEHVRVRDEEKIELARLAERTPIPIKESLEEPSAKTNVLLQAYISRLSLHGLALRADMIHISQNAARLTRALALTAAALKRATAFAKCQNLFKNVAKRQWSTQTPLRQFGNLISAQTIRRIERKDVPFERYFDLEVQALQDLAKDKEAGRRLHKLIHCLPRVQLEASARPTSRSSLEVNLTLAPDFQFDGKLHRREESFWISVEDGDSEHLLYAGLHRLRPFVTKQQTISCLVRLSIPQPNHFLVRCVSDAWIAPVVAVPISLRDLVLPRKFEAFSEFPTTNNLSVARAFESISFVEDQDITTHQASMEMQENVRFYYRRQFSKFPPLVSHLFPSFFDSTENAVLAVSPTRERDICGELSVARLFSANPTASAVWVIAKGSIATQRAFRTLSNGIGKALNLNVIKIDSFESTNSQALQKAGTLIIAEAHFWDQFSRKWRQKRTRRVLEKIELMVLDGVQALSNGNGEGATLEALASRTRYLAATTGSERPLRMVALSDPIANAENVGQWLGVKSSFVFSYNPDDWPNGFKPEVLPILRRSFDYQPGSLVRLIHAVLKRKSWRPEDQVIVFVPTLSLAQRCVNEINIAGALETLAKYPGSPELMNHVTDGRLGARIDFPSVKAAYIDPHTSNEACQSIEQSFTRKEYAVLFSTPDYAWGTSLTSSLVVIAGTKRVYDNVDSCSNTELARTDLLQMVFKSRSSVSRKHSGVVILTEENTKDRYEHILEPSALESRLPERFADHLNAEIASGVVKTKQDAVDYLTWTYFYHRLTQNPNYYGLQGLAPTDISRHLSELVEFALSDLEGSKCVAVEGEEDVALGALNLGIIASHYYVRHETVEFFAASVNPRVKLRSILDILSFAWEFRHIEVRHSDIETLSDIASKVPYSVDPEMQDMMASISSRHKTHLLLQAHLSRIDLGPDLCAEQCMIVSTCVRLLRALVDVVASAGWLKPALVAVELSQMLVQCIWDLNLPLLQLPYMTNDIVTNLKNTYRVSDVFEFLDMEGEHRMKALEGLTNDQLREVSAACDIYPNLDEIEASAPVTEELPDGTKVMRLTVFVNRNEDTEDESERVTADEVPFVAAQRYPGTKVEGWWIILGNPLKNSLFTLKYFNIRQKAAVKLSYTMDNTTSSTPKEGKIHVYLVSDSYIDCDQEEVVSVS